MSSMESAKAEFLDILKDISEQNTSEDGKPEPIYSSFVRWVCENVLDISNPSDIEDAISIGGSHDYDTDFFVHNAVGDEKTEQYICWGQVKFSETFDKVVKRHEMETFGKTLTYLSECPPDANATFKQKSILFNKLGGRNSTNTKKMRFIVAGTLSPEVDVLLDSKDWKRTLETIRGPPIDFKIITINDILSEFIRPKTDSLQIQLNGHQLIREDTSTQKESIIGYVEASELVRLVQNYSGMFGLNVRESLGKGTPTYESMTKTLNDPKRKKQFWKFNNGITATCTSFDEIKKNPNVYEINDFKVVNGRQTTFCLNENYKKNPTIIDSSVLVPITIHQAENIDEINEITRATNTQNLVKYVDLISNSDEINSLVIKCRHKFPDFYFERQTKGFKAADKSVQKRVTKKRLLDKNETARAYITYSTGMPNDGLISDRELYSHTDPTYFNLVFQNREIQDLIVPHIFMSMLNALDLKWSKEIKSGDETHSREKSILHKEITRYFLLDLFGVTMRELSSDQRTQIESKIIVIMQGLENKDVIPQKFLDIAFTCYDFFMDLFDDHPSLTWPKELNAKIEAPGYKPDPFDKPSGFDVMQVLKKKGDAIRSKTQEKRLKNIKKGQNDLIKNVLLDLLDN